MKKGFLLLNILLLLAATLPAQTGEYAFNFLRLPASPHAAALGGNNISLIEDDLSLAMHNPALLVNVSDNTIDLSFMTYMSDCKVGGVAFSKTFGSRSSAALSARYADYGRFEGYTPDNIHTGTFTAKDIEAAATYSYMLSERWSGGVSGKFIYSKYETMSAIALGVDLGLNYYDANNDFSLSFACKNLGGQVKAFEDELEKIPLDFQVGLTKGFAHAPIRISAMLNNLHKWDKDDFYNADGSEDNFGTILLKHLTIGADILIGSNLYLAAGYNFRTGKELSTGKRGLNGFSIGAGLNVRKVKFNASYSQLHTSSSSLLFNIAYSL